MFNSRFLNWAVLSFLFVVISILTIMYFRLGLHKDPIKVGPVTKQFNFLYKTHVGPYHEVSETLFEVEAFAKTLDIDCSVTFGQYLDDPEVIDPDRLRSNVGCVIDNPTKYINADESGIFKVKILKPRKYFQINFDGSPAIGPMKVYPLAKKILPPRDSKENQAVIEVYHIKDGGASIVTEYFFLLNK